MRNIHDLMSGGIDALIDGDEGEKARAAVLNPALLFDHAQSIPFCAFLCKNVFQTERNHARGVIVLDA
jgi:hypothetical protein